MINKKDIENNVVSWVENYIESDFQFREHQLETIVDIIYSILSSNHTNYICEAPTGSGKSLINIISAGVLSEYYNLTSYILVSDLFLWEQYDSFLKNHKKIDFGSIKGQTGNYTCLLNKEDIRNADCRMAGISWAAMFNPATCKKYGYDCAVKCKYLKARKKAIRSRVCLMTYQLFLFALNNLAFNTQGNGEPIFSSRDVIFCDECHNIPDIVQNQYSPCIKETDFEKLDALYCKAANDELNLFNVGDVKFDIVTKYTRKSLQEELYKIWEQFKKEDSAPADDIKAMNDYKDIIVQFVEIASDIVSTISEAKQHKLPISKDDIKLFKLCTWFQNYCCFWSDFNTAINEAGEEYLLKDICVANDDGHISVSFRCTKEDYMIYRYLLSRAKHKVLLSATIGGHDAYEENMGFRYLTDEEVKYNTLPNTFNFTKSPIHFLNKFKMSFREKEKSFNRLKDIIYSICETKFGNEKGIIQTGSYAFAKQLYNEAPPALRKRMLLYNGSKEKNVCIKIHDISPNTILVGPSLNEGIDLPGDLCRFIIIMKVPYPSLADRLVKEKIKLFPHWYNSTTSNDIIQGIGRGVRYNGDWCVSYILDACFWRLYLETQDQYPDDFKNRLNII